jgi:signal transduction histidine kinase
MPGIVKRPAMADRRLGEVGACGVASNGSLPVDLLARLGWLCDAFHAQSGIDCRLEARPEHAHLDPVAGDVLYRTLRELYVLYKRAQTRRIVVVSELREDGSVAFHVGFDLEGAQPRVSPLECDAVALWDIDQRLREVGAYLELRNEPGICTSVVFPRQLVVLR